MVTKITIQLGNRTIELTLGEAQELYAVLHVMFGQHGKDWRKEPLQITWRVNESFPSLDTVDTTGMGK